MKRIVKLKERDITRIVKQVLTETIEEYGMGLAGAYGASRENLKNKMRLGYLQQVKPNGKTIQNHTRISNAQKRLKEMIQEKFIETFGTEGVDLSCMCWYYKTSAYDFTFHMKGIEQINTHDFSIIGDIINVEDDDLAPSLQNALFPKIKNNVVLVYNLANRTLSFTVKKSGLTIKPYDNGSDAWSKLLGLVGKYNAGFMKIAR